MKFPCTLKNALLIIRDRFGLYFASKGLGYLAALLLLLLLLARYKLSCYQTTRYLQFQHLQTIPYWKPLVIFFCSSLGSTLLLIEKTYNWSPILVGHQWNPRIFPNINLRAVTHQIHPLLKIWIPATMLCHVYEEAFSDPAFSMSPSG